MGSHQFGEDLATIARSVWGGDHEPSRFHAAFEQAAVYARRPDCPGIYVAEVQGRGRWTVVFSTPDRLAAREGADCPYLSTTGADLLQLVPAGVGVMVDPDDAHRFPILTRMVSVEALTRAWDDWAGCARLR